MSKKRKKAESLLLVTATIVSVVAAGILFFRYTSTGKYLTAKAAAHYLHGAVEFVPGNNRGPENLPESVFGEERNQAGEENETDVSGNQEQTVKPGFEKDGIYHLLLLGEEAIRSAPGKGRTDSILLLSIHTGQQKCHITSILRDSYVEPEGMNPCKINAVYAKQGVEGLYHLLYDKLGVWPDGYAKVGFDSFEELIDMLGGAQVTLTSQEAEYLNSHNYISKKEYRNVKEGTQVLNGNQTLGYCRVRYVPNCNGTAYDYGRTERQRMVLEDLFQRYKEAGLLKWVSILKKGLGSIETDLSEEVMEELIFVMDEYNIRELEQHQLPAKGTFDSVKELNGVTSTLVTDWDKNRTLFWNNLEKNK